MRLQTSPARGQALADATQQAMNKARSIAQAPGGKVLRVVEANEGATVNQDQQTRYEQYTYSGAENRKQTPVMPGQLSVKSNVQLIVEIEN